MPQEYVDNDAFLTRLTSAFKGAGEPDSRAGSVWMTHKRYTFEDTKDTVKPSGNQDDVEMEASNDVPAGGKQFDVLIRCTNGSDVNFSTRIPPTLLPTFHAHYSSLLKSTLAPSMIKRDKKKEKVKAEKREAWKKTLYQDVGTGSRKEETGKKVGHRQRARRLQAQRKKETQREELEERERTSKPAI